MKTTRTIIVVSIIALFSAKISVAQLAPNAPQDNAQAIAERQAAALQSAIAPYISAARQTYPMARARFLGGLPKGEIFFVVTRLTDSAGHWEQVFIRVKTIAGGLIFGVLSSEVKLVSGYKPGQSYAFMESDLIDWLIAKPDGSEEGNVVGKFLDTYRP
jgi:hypothetical protein